MNTALNGICPYFTMFPLAFPGGILKRHAARGDTVLDPFAGRGTTLYAARLNGLRAYGIDSNPVAVAISEAKLANTTPGRITAAARRILNTFRSAPDVPTGPFWELAFDEAVLATLCRLRAGLLADCESASRKALRAIILGALHGPLAKTQQSYFSNQSPRTYGPKPAYAVRFWRERELLPPKVDVLEVINRRAVRYYGEENSIARGNMTAGDSQLASSFAGTETKPAWIVTSPPYYGMRTYIPDQWLRNWFLGGPPAVDYTNRGQLTHFSREGFPYCKSWGKAWGTDHALGTEYLPQLIEPYIGKNTGTNQAAGTKPTSGFYVCPVGIKATDGREIKTGGDVDAGAIDTPIVAG